MTDLNDVVAAIENLRADLRDALDEKNDEVVSALNKVQHAVESRPKTAHSVTALICGVLIYVLISSWATSVGGSKQVLAMRYGVPTEKVVIGEMPHDCDFWRAPLGGKGCSYTRETVEVKTGVNAAGQHVVTYDDGKTWTLIEDPSQVQTGVFVMWKRQ